ncbi:MAG: hypothetical protein KGM92_04630 [Acidobacteriota bacterium]|nr:hypothetical protein [Acidobacteriota bacterium]
MAHFAIGGLMHEAALQADEDPDRLSFVHAVHVVQRRMSRYVTIPLSEKSLPEMVLQENSAAARQFQSQPDQSPGREAQDEQLQPTTS